TDSGRSPNGLRPAILSWLDQTPATSSGADLLRALCVLCGRASSLSLRGSSLDGVGTASGLRSCAGASRRLRRPVFPSPLRAVCILNCGARDLALRGPSLDAVGTPAAKDPSSSFPIFPQSADGGAGGRQRDAAQGRG